MARITSEKRQVEKEKNKSSVVKYCTITVGVILMLSVAFVFMVFKTDFIINMDTDGEINSANFERVSVSSVIEEIHDLEGGSGIPYVEGPEESDNLNRDLYHYTVTINGGSSTASPDGISKSVYDGWPWGDQFVQVCNIQKCEEHVIETIAKNNGIDVGSVNQQKPTVVTDDYGMHGQQSTTVDGIDCTEIVFVHCYDMPDVMANSLAGGPVPDVGKAHYQDASARHAAIIFAEKDDESKVYYLPIIFSDAKIHNWPGGTMQTYVAHTNNDNLYQLANKFVDASENTIDSSSSTLTSLGFKYLGNGSDYGFNPGSYGSGDGGVFEVQDPSAVLSLWSSSNSIRLYYGQWSTPITPGFEAPSDSKSTLKAILSDYDLIGIGIGAE